MLTAIGDVMREFHRRGWISTRDGNISLQKSGSRNLYITPSGARKTIIHPEHVVKLQWDEDRDSTISHGKNPSGELRMHELLQRTALKTRSVVHAHPTHTVAAMFAGFDLQQLVNYFPELSRYTRVGPVIPNCRAISQTLAELTYIGFTDQQGKLEEWDSTPFRITESFRLFAGGEIDWHLAPRFDIVGQINHGVTAIGDNPWDAFEHIERLNHICEMVLLSGVRPNQLM